MIFLQKCAGINGLEKVGGKCWHERQPYLLNPVFLGWYKINDYESK